MNCFDNPCFNTYQEAETALDNFFANQPEKRELMMTEKCRCGKWHVKARGDDEDQT